MKTKTTFKFLFIICLLTNFGTSFNAFGQLNHFLPDSNAYMSVSPYKFWFMGDTIINSNQYKKVYVQSYDSIADFTQTIYFAAVREDTLNEKIYCLQKLDSIERLIADFNVQAGDTVNVYAYSWILNLNDPWLMSKTSTVLSVDSILIHGNYHKRININEGHQWGAPYSESWIEGIGSTWGLFFPNVHIDASTIGLPFLLCVNIDDTLFYQNSFFTTCYLHDYFIGIDKNNKHEIKIYPTLAKNTLHIDFENDWFFSTTTVFSIYDVQGKLLLKNILNSNVIDITDLSKGFYLLNIYNAERQITINNKFLKN